ncbi:MAG: aldolase catalytic domain-containing protein [Oscillospiraceae bacterium]|nr:aldolase catalytic domain-containing protein [Oscillospiraceae bacterium]
MISILDCTLRDGGYVNNWTFGEKLIRMISQKICLASIEYIEGGFLSQTKKSNENQSIFRTIKMAEKYFENCQKNVALMINCGEYNVEDIPPYTMDNITTLRIAFHKHQKEEAQKLCVSLKNKGYKVFFQPMVTMGYSDNELLSLIDWANKYSPDAFYIVDSFGTMRRSDVLRMFYLIDNNLDKGIKIGFHSHNNLQLSFSNAQELIQMNSKRDIIIDSSIFGMGRGAGNLCTELITQYINENIEKKYDIIPLLEAMDEYIMPIYSQHPWGYSAPYYIAATNNCHPNYATFLMNKGTLCIRDINSIIKSIPDENKNLYNEELIGKMYFDYQQKNIDDSEIIDQLSELCSEREILILAPGKSLITHEKNISAFIERSNPVVFAINHIPERYRFDKVFVSNMKRFKGIDDAADKLGERLICTSNISRIGSVQTVNYSAYLNDDEVISDNAGLMLINILKKAGVKKINLAGYDGFGYSEHNNYCDEKLVSNVRYERRAVLNEAMKEYFKNIRKSIEINFITPTIYACSDGNEKDWILSTV